MTYVSIDNITRKYLYPVGDYCVETTYVDYHNKHIICFSSMVGCPIGCKFCASGYGKYIRPLTAKEMIDQCMAVIHEEGIVASEKPILFSCMGEGEPLANYRNVVDALTKLGKCHPKSKIALSTSGGRPDQIVALATQPFPVPFKLQVSIHHTNDNMRKLMIPVTHPLRDIWKAIDTYRHSGRDLELNYVLIAGMNDDIFDALMLAVCANGATIKLNTFNPIDESIFQRSENVEQFIEVLKAHGAKYELYSTDGTDIKAGCGQLTYKARTNGEVAESGLLR